MNGKVITGRGEHCFNCENAEPGHVIKTKTDGTDNFCVDCGKIISFECSHTVNVNDLATAHWEYVFTTINAHTGMEIDGKEYVICKHHYISAFIHGYKHGKEAM